MADTRDERDELDILYDIVVGTISEITDSVVSKVGEYTFCGRESLRVAEFPMAEAIVERAFYSCGNLASISFPRAEYVGTTAFGYCDISLASFPSASWIGSSAFASCSSLLSASFPIASEIGAYAFYDCHGLTNASFPSAESVGAYAFTKCSQLASVDFPNASTLMSNAFLSCQSLSTARFPSVASIGSYAFNSCFNLVELHLEGVPSVPSLGANAFNSTPIGGYSASAGRYGSVFVPASLYDAFLSATNWSSIASHIVSVA